MAKMPRLITGLTRQRERVIQDRMMTRIEMTMESLLARDIKRTMLLMADNYSSPGKMAEIKLNHEYTVERILVKGYKTSLDWFGGRILDGATKSGSGFERKDLFGGYDKAVIDWIRRYTGLKITEIAGTTYKQVIAIVEQAIKDAVTAGLAEREIGRLIRDAVSDKSSISVARSRVIARTEVHAASQAGVHIAAESIDLPTREEWISALGPRTREDHAAADGQITQMNEPFIVGGEQLMYPGDPAGSAEQIINCRCILGIVID